MKSLIAYGGRSLKGKISVQGAKNTALPIIAATLLIKGTVKLYSCPKISDTEQMFDIIRQMGARTEWTGKCVEICTDNMDGVLNFSMCSKLRASSLFMGALLGRNGYFAMPYPGGCDIGKRPLDFHIDGLRLMGAHIDTSDNLIIGICHSLHGAEYEFPYPSVGALENLILAGVCAKGQSRFTNCAREPEIADLCEFLNKAGAKIRGAGTDTIIIEGTDCLNPVSYTIPGDRIVAGTYMMACAVTGGNICIGNIEPDRVDSVTFLLRKMGCHIFTDKDKNEIIVESDDRKRALPYVTTGPYPEFATDMQPQLMALCAYLMGTSVICDKVFENRYHIISQLKLMGADAEIKDNDVIIHGKEKLYGGLLTAHDLRQGAALVVAALGAEGKTQIKNCHYIFRGYEDIARDLALLGANIKWQEEEKKED